MWPIRKKTNPRRVEARKSAAAAQAPRWRRFREAGGLAAVVIAVLFYAGAMAMDSWPVEPLPYRIGQYYDHDITARVSFAVESRRRFEEEESRIRSITPATFAPDANLINRIVADLKALPERVGAATQPAELPEGLQKQFSLVEPNSLGVWRAQTQPSQADEFAAQIDRLREQLARLPIVLKKEKEDQIQRGAAQAYLGKELRPIYELIALDEPNRIEAEVQRAVQKMAPGIRPNIEAYLIGTFLKQPLYLYDTAATKKDIDDRRAALAADPPRDRFDEGQRLVTRRLNEAANKLEEPDIKLLAEEHRQFLAKEKKEQPWQPWMRLGGRAVMLLFVVALMSIYIARYQPRIVRKPLRALSIAIVLLLTLGATKLLCQTAALNPFVATLPVLTAAFILAIAYDQRFALAVMGITLVIVVFQLRMDLSMLLVLMAGVAVTVGCLREIRTRSKPILVAAAAALTVLLSIWAQDLAAGVPWWSIALLDGAWGASMALASGFLVEGILPLIERAFGSATSMTLLEWCDANRPLLRRLAIEAPGTYEHSLQLGTMCEAAAEAIGARGLLARVGAYYHDVGKINKPDYFVENQAGSASPHTKLSPAMSLLIITGHVKDGMELAKEYGLPRMLLEFVATHHGTTLVQYFYHAATERRKAGSERAPDEVEFRYPGPKPRSKEAAILMLADAAESSVHSMGEATPGRIENQVHTMIARRLMDGQLDECDLTLREVHLIEASLIRSLCGIYHSRIAYPKLASRRAAESKRENGREDRGALGVERGA